MERTESPRDGLLPREERVGGAGVGASEVSAPPLGGTMPPLEGPAPHAGGLAPSLDLVAWVHHLTHERHRSPGFGCQSDAGAREPRLGFRP